MTNKVVFVARKYGGSRLGPDRMNCYIESALGALQKKGVNQITGEEQQPNLELETKLQKAIERRYRYLGNPNAQPNQQLQESQESIDSTQLKNHRESQSAGTRGSTGRRYNSAPRRSRPSYSRPRNVTRPYQQNYRQNGRPSNVIRGTRLTTQNPTTSRGSYSNSHRSPQEHFEHQSATRYEQYLNDLEKYSQQVKFKFSNPQYIGKN